MKTVLIWDQCGQEMIKFAVLDGDYRRLNRTYINMGSEDEDELNCLVYNNETGKYLLNFSEEFPYNTVKEGAFVIVAGILP